MVSIQNKIGTRYRFAEIEAAQGQGRLAFQGCTRISLLESQVS